jgi:hypothetical protein
MPSEEATESWEKITPFAIVCGCLPILIGYYICEYLWVMIGKCCGSVSSAGTAASKGLRDQLLAEGEYVPPSALMQIHIPRGNPLGESTNLRKPGLCPDEHKAKQDTARTTGTCKRCNSQVAARDQILRCPSCSWWTCKNCSIAEASLWEQAHGAEKFTEVKEAKTTCAKTQQAIEQLMRRR